MHAAPAASPHPLKLPRVCAGSGHSCVLWVPIDVVKERMQIQRVLRRPRAPVAAAADGATGAATVKPPLVYRNGVHALQSIVKSEGVVGLYRGYGATLLSFGPFSALFFMMHEEVRVESPALHGSFPEPRNVSPSACL